MLFHVKEAGVVLTDLPPSPGYAPEKIQYGIDRYVNETRRLYRTMDTHLGQSTHGFLVGDRVTIADIACWGWVASHSESRLQSCAS